MKFEHLGWAAAAALVGVVVGTGFQATTTKIGIVDMGKVFSDSEFAKAQSEQLKAVGTSRQGILEFINDYRTFTVDQAARFRALSMKPNLTAPEKAELEKIKNDVMKANGRLKDLQTKANPTPAESTEMNQLSQQVQTTTETAQRWSREFNDEVQNMQDKLRGETLTKVKDAVKEVGKAGGYSVIFVSDVAPYAANDVTPDALKSVNKK